MSYVIHFCKNTDCNNVPFTFKLVVYIPAGLYLPPKAPIGYKNIETKEKQKIIVIDETKAFFCSSCI